MAAIHNIKIKIGTWEDLAEFKIIMTQCDVPNKSKYIPGNRSWVKAILSLDFSLKAKRWNKVYLDVHQQIISL
jgi:hypothetical protein